MKHKYHWINFFFRLFDEENLEENYRRKKVKEFFLLIFEYRFFFCCCCNQRLALKQCNVHRFNEEFHTQSLLGSGEFGNVYLCVNRLDGCAYAIKKSKRPIAGSSFEYVLIKFLPLNFTIAFSKIECSLGKKFVPKLCLNIPIFFNITQHGQKMIICIFKVNFVMVSRDICFTYGLFTHNFH